MTPWAATSANFLLYADKVTWEEEIQDLTAPIFQSLESKGPAIE
jgi:hypothetical protein